MVIAAVLCLCAAVAVGGTGVWLLTRAGDPSRQALRAVAPTQIAAAVMLAGGGVVGLSAPHGIALLAVIACVIGAVATVAAGCWQTAKAMARTPAVADTGGCAGSCASCTLSCQ
jgi:hypothetical protein